MIIQYHKWTNSGQEKTLVVAMPPVIQLLLWMKPVNSKPGGYLPNRNCILIVIVKKFNKGRG